MLEMPTFRGLAGAQSALLPNGALMTPARQQILDQLCLLSRYGTCTPQLPPTLRRDRHAHIFCPDTPQGAFACAALEAHA